jgi:FkbM family methyltransferase
MDRVKPVLRRLGYATQLQRELRRHLDQLTSALAIQVGAHDGVTHDPFREYLIRPGWCALVVEPNPSTFQMLNRNYESYRGVTAINAAVSYTEAELTLWRFDECYLETRPDRQELSTLVSFSRDNMRQFLGGNESALEHLSPIRIPAITIERLLQQHNWRRVDALFVDVEGYENEILMRADIQLLDPRIIVFENHLLPDRGAAIKQRLETFGFSSTDVDADTVAVRPAVARGK